MLILSEANSRTWELSTAKSASESEVWVKESYLKDDMLKRKACWNFV